MLSWLRVFTISFRLMYCRRHYSIRFCTWNSRQSSSFSCDRVQTGHFRVKSVCYSLPFRGWAWGPSVLWVKNRLGYLRKARECPSVGLWGRRAGLGGQTGEMVQTEQFGAKSLCYSPRFWGRSRVRACCGLKIDWGVPGRVGSGLVWSIGVGGAIWMVKRENCKKGLFSASFGGR